MSFEKRGDRPDEARRRLTEAGVAWRARRYHRVPAVASTVWDVWVGTRVIRRELLRRHPDVVHVRSYVPALMATRAMSDTGPALLFDIRGFWADERVEGGMWRPNGALYRLAKRYERRFFERADAVVTLTHASVPWIRERTRSPEIPVRVIPTCTDTTRFANAAPRPNGPHVVWCGSLGTWYRFDLGVRLARAVRCR